MDVDKLFDLVKEHCGHGTLHADDVKKTIAFVIRCLAYEWQDGGEIEVIQLFKSCLKN